MATRSTTSQYMPPPPGKVIPEVGMFHNVAIVGAAPRGNQQPGPNIGAPPNSNGTHGAGVFVAVASIIS